MERKTSMLLRILVKENHLIFYDKGSLTYTHWRVAQHWFYLVYWFQWKWTSERLTLCDPLYFDFPFSFPFLFFSSATGCAVMNSLLFLTRSCYKMPGYSSHHCCPFGFIFIGLAKNSRKIPSSNPSWKHHQQLWNL